jgi:hypothetical protein
MSLFALPVSLSELTQLQLGVEFFTNTTEATTELGLFTNPPGVPTVYSYALGLLANNISLSQVAMAVDSLMFGVTDTTTELAKLSTQFLPAQVTHAVANGFDPTVYAAEALGLGLAGGNGTSNAFANTLGELNITAFAQAVSGDTGVNASAIQQFAQNWINFYTANPSATFGLPVTVAAYGAAFGDAIGVALVNPTVNGSTALLVSEVQNALIDNAEGLYQPGIPVVAELPPVPLQGEAVLIPNAGGDPFGQTLDWSTLPGNYARFIAPPQSAQLTIENAPGTFTLDAQHYGAGGAVVDSVGQGILFTLILGDSTAGDDFGSVAPNGYSTMEIVLANGPGPDSVDVVEGPSTNLVISGSGSLSIFEARVPTITDVGVSLALDETGAEKIDASNAPILVMNTFAVVSSTLSGVTVLGGAVSGNILHGSLASLGTESDVTFSNGSTGVVFNRVGADNFTLGSGGGDLIYTDGGADTMTLPKHTLSDTMVFGEEKGAGQDLILAITDGMDMAYFGSWGAGKTPAAIPTLFSDAPSGGTSADMTVITGFQAGSGGDEIDFKTTAWNGESTLLGSAQGDLVSLDSFSTVALGAAQLSKLWTNSGSTLMTSDNVLLYAPSDASLQNAQQLAAELHTASGAVVLPGSGVSGSIGPGDDRHILVAYDAGNNTVNIADVDLVNMSTTNSQSSTANLNVYASDMVRLVDASLTSLTPDNIHFI